MPLERNQDYMNVCNPDGKYTVDAFAAGICSQRARPECVRSSYRQSATDKRLEAAEKLTTFIDPKEQLEESPLSHYPDELNEDGKFIHRAEVAGTAEESATFDAAAQALAQLALPPQAHPEVVEIPPAAPPTESTPEPPRPKDPWTAPEGVRMNIYKEFEEAKDDPWSAEYEGPRRIKAESGVTITLSGRTKK